jgi:2TM domain
MSRRWAVRAFRWHLGLFCLLNAALTLANVLTGMPWWAFWPLLVTSLLIGVHYLVYKAVTVDETWAEERVEELNLKSYDRSHIEELKSRYGEPPKR